MHGFDAETAMRVGGWDRRYARVLDVQVDSDGAAALIDTNGDGSELNVDVYLCEHSGQWRIAASGNGSIGVPGWLAIHESDHRLTLKRVPGDH